MKAFVTLLLMILYCGLSVAQKDDKSKHEKVIALLNDKQYHQAIDDELLEMIVADSIKTDLELAYYFYFKALQEEKKGEHLLACKFYNIVLEVYGRKEFEILSELKKNAAYRVLYVLNNKYTDSFNSIEAQFLMNNTLDRIIHESWQYFSSGIHPINVTISIFLERAANEHNLFMIDLFDLFFSSLPTNNPHIDSYTMWSRYANVCQLWLYLYELLAGEQIEQNNIEGAEKLYIEADIKSEKSYLYHKNWGDLVEFCHDRGEILYEQAKKVGSETLYTMAADKFEKAIQASYTYSDYFDADRCIYRQQKVMALYYAAMLGHKIELMEQACKEFENIIVDEWYKKNISNPLDQDKAYLFWGMALAKLAAWTHDNSFYKLAFDKFQKATELCPDCIDPYNQWGIALSKLAEQTKDIELYKQAIDKYEKIIDIDPEIIQAYSNSGIALINMAEITEDVATFWLATEVYKKAIEIEPEYSIGYNNWGLLLLTIAEKEKKGQLYEEAIEKIKKAIEIDPDVAKYYSSWINVLWGLVNFENNFPKYQGKILKRINQCKNIDENEAAFHFACYYSWTKEYDEALIWMEKSLKNTNTPRHTFEEDENLKNLRAKRTKEFNSLLNEYRQVVANN